MPTIDIQVRRFSVVSSRPFEDIVGRLTATIGHPDMNAFHGAVAAATTAADLEDVVHGAIGSSDLMEFARFDAGEILRKERGGQGPRILRLLVGNPLIMKEMAKTVPDAASYAPVTILVDERADGVHLSYDSMASLLAPYGSQSALVVARDLDAKIERSARDCRAVTDSGDEHQTLLGAAPVSGARYECVRAREARGATRSTCPDSKDDPSLTVDVACAFQLRLPRRIPADSGECGATNTIVQ